VQVLSTSSSRHSSQGSRSAPQSASAIFSKVSEALTYRDTGEASHLAIAVISAVSTLAMGYRLTNRRRSVGRRR
jgi:hypothetical protein